MKTLRKFGGWSALYLALAYLICMPLFLVVLNYAGTTDPAARVTLLVENQTVFVTTNLLMYVSFGVLLVVLALALYDRLKGAAPALAQFATVMGIVWAASLIASGMVSNAGIGTVISLYATDPAQAAVQWQTIDAVASGLGNGNGEILGGLWTLLVSVAALRSGALPRGLNILGLLVGGVGILSLVPVLTPLVGIFGLAQIVWFVWLGIVLLRGSRAAVA